MNNSIFKKLTQDLRTTYENTMSKHSGTIGKIREEAVRNYLIQTMPKKYGFKSGEVFDEKMNISGQIDVIIHDNLFSNYFSSTETDIMSPVESTYGIISIKSKMGIKELNHAIEGIKKYNDLERPKANDNEFYITPTLKINSGKNLKIKRSIQQNINCIFAFDTKIAPETLEKKVYESKCIDLLIIPEKMYLIGRVRENQPIFNSAPLTIKSKESLAIFTILLNRYLNYSQLIASDYNDFLISLIQEAKKK